MLTLVTGAPGSGKTLWTMREVEKLRKDTGRPVFYNGIAGVAIPEWTLFEDSAASKVHELPQGAIIVVDEVYRLWPQGKQGEQLRPDVEAFATHRHRGHDFYLLIQDRMRLHHFIRGLVGRHVHFERQFGLDRSRMFEWQRLGDPRDKWDKDAASASEFMFPKEVFQWYKSADLHTVKKRMPWLRLSVIPALVVVAALCTWFAFSRLSADRLAKPAGVAVAASEVHPALSYLEQKELEARQWSAKWVERVPGQPHSASFYDPTVTPAVMPKISGCSEVITDHSYKCECNTQQGTIITTLTIGECKFYLKNGWFDPTKPDRQESDGTLRAGGFDMLGAGSPLGGQAGSSAPAAPPSAPVLN